MSRVTIHWPIDERSDPHVFDAGSGGGPTLTFPNLVSIHMTEQELEVVRDAIDKFLEARGRQSAALTRGLNAYMAGGGGSARGVSVVMATDYSNENASRRAQGIHSLPLGGGAGPGYCNCCGELWPCSTRRAQT